MNIISSLFSAILATTLTVSADRNYKSSASRNLLSTHLDRYNFADCSGYSFVPSKSSVSQCSLALELIAKQPQSCAQKFLSGSARNIYLPTYNWFVGSLDQLQQYAIQFSLDNVVGVEIYDAFGVQIVKVSTSGILLPLDTPNPASVSFELVRSWSLNYPTFLREESDNEGSITQNIWSVSGELLTIKVMKELNLLPAIC